MLIKSKIAEKGLSFQSFEWIWIHRKENEYYMALGPH